MSRLSEAAVPRQEAKQLLGGKRADRLEEPGYDHFNARSRSSVSSCLEQPAYCARASEHWRDSFRLRSRSMASVVSDHYPCSTASELSKATPRTPVVRRHPRFETLRGRDGTELRICLDREQRRRETQAPGLGLSLFEFRSRMLWNDTKHGYSLPEEPQRGRNDSDTSTNSMGSMKSPRLRERAKTQDVRYEMLQMAGDSSGRVQLQRIGEHGFTAEDISRVIYDKFRDQDLPDFLDYIGLERKGGLDRIGEIWSPEKYFWFFFLIGSVLFNMTYLLAMDWVIFSAFTKEVLAEAQQSMDLRNVTEAVGSLGDAQTYDIAKRVRDPELRWWLLNVAAFVATWEVCWVCVKVIHTIYIWWIFCFGGSEYRSFHAITFFFQKLLPQCSTFSALKMMAKVHPSLIYNEYLYFVFESSWRATWSGLVLVSVWFFLKCVVCAMAALGAFTIKVLAVGMKLLNTQYSVLYRVGSIAALMNQCMGCVIMEVVLQDRLFLFVFGGQDAMYHDRGIAYKNVYECRMAKQIWEEFWVKGRKLKAIVLYATFDHYDLQRLLLESTPEDYHNVDIGLADCAGMAAVDSPAESLIPINEAALDREGSAGLDSDESEVDFAAARYHPALVRKVYADEQPEAEDEEEDADGARRGCFVEARGDSRPGCGVHNRDTSRADSFTSSTASLGMRAVTVALQNEAGWRDAM